MAYDDSWYWHGDPKGCYLVKNDYRTNRALSDILPTTKNLLIKRVEVDPICAMCGINQGDTMKILVLCDFARTIWCESNLPIPNIVTNVFHTWFEEVTNILDTNGMMFTTAILYHIWRARNGAVWEACLPTPLKLVATATAALHAWRQAHPDSSPPSSTEAAEPTTSSAAAFNLVAAPLRRCRFDARFQSSANKATVGAVLFDESGSYVVAFNANLPDCFSPLISDAFACKEALSWLRDRGENLIELHTDCLSLQHYLSSVAGPVSSYVGFAIN
ncbi:PREDICTED: uncharacterized protein LOC109177253 [Ipomoea nil]|uniref:uncharacterized protein LOC109177253 n=1 Tax=Ipomoea nil TaxID=35883 RepID=UPI0009015EB2|nr:PREDICTED: uncharacterized protein LOC109177253 [Ipomoea nil]